MPQQTLTDDLERFLRDYYREDIGELAQKYPSEQRSIEVDWMDLYRYDPDIANDYLDQPRRVGDMLEEALRLYDLPVDVRFDDASVRITNLPDNRTFDVGGYRSDHIGKFLGVYGQVTKSTQVKPRPEEIEFRCARCETKTTVKQSGNGISEPHECRGCERQGPFRKDFENSKFTDHQLVRVQQPPEQTKGGQGAHVDVHLEDDLVESVSPGDRVTIGGIMSLEEPDDGDITFDPYIDGNSVEIEETDYTDIDTSEHEDEIKAIANGERGDPYELLIGSIAPTIEGVEHIKLAIALQLFGGVRVEYPDGSADRGDSHILLLGDPGTAKSSLLRGVENIAPRSTYASGKGASAAGMTAAAVPDDFGSERWSLEAGALVLAHKGVACVDEIDKIDDEAVSSLHDALESQRVNVNKAGMNAQLPAQTALLAAGNPKYGRFEQYEPIAEQIDLGPTLLSRFDLMFMIDDQPDEERDRDVADFMVSTRRKPTETEMEIDLETLRAYIAYAKQNVEPRIQSESVHNSLVESFTQLRLANGDDQNVPIPVTFRKLEGIMRLAEASARVRFSNEVTESDIQRAQELVARSMRDVGFDEDANQFDADIVETGSAKSQRDRLHTILDIANRLGREYDDAPSVDMILEKAEEANIRRGRAKLDIKKLKQQGEIYEPKSGHIRTT